MYVQYVGNQLPYDTINELRQRMADVAPHLAKNDTVESPMWLNGEYFKVLHVSSSPSMQMWSHAVVDTTRASAFCAMVLRFGFEYVSAMLRRLIEISCCVCCLHWPAAMT